MGNLELDAGKPLPSHHRELFKCAIIEACHAEPSDSAYCVGCVITSPDGTILATGFSRELPGNTHAEEVALSRCNPKDLEGCTIITTMEPCSLRLSGKTPCVERILATSARQVIVGVREPSHFVEDCDGCEQLRNAGIDVYEMNRELDGDLYKMCQRLNNHLTDSPVSPTPEENSFEGTSSRERIMNMLRNSSALCGKKSN
eukprot:Clim_evm9s196 gene=Clim_evmTU9s196